MVVRVLLFACVWALTLAPFSATALAQSQRSGFIVVTVTDASTGKPIDNAQVFLLGGDEPQSSLTNAKGLLIFENVQPGIYRVQVKAGGYADSDAAEADVGEADRVNVAVALVPSMPTIADVVVRGGVNVTTQSITEQSPERKVSQSLVDALGKIAGVDVEDQLYGSDSAFNISLHGADASQTAYSIDGVQVRGAAAQAMGGLQDLFGGASVNFSPGAMSPAGMVSFYTAQPTKLWTYRFSGVAGNYGDTLGNWTIGGGAGKTAMVFEHSAGGQDFPLDGRFYTDASGYAYTHQGGLSRTADMFKISLALSPATSVKYSILGGSARRSNICSSATALLPCGFGPGVISHSGNVMQTLSLSSIAGHVEYNIFANAGRFHSTDDEPNRTLNGVVNPYASSGSYPWWSAGLYTSASARRHTLSGGAFLNGNGSRFTSTYNASGSTSNVREERFGSIWVGDKVKSNDKLAVDYTLSQASGTGAGSNLELYAQATWQPRTADVFTLGTGIGSAQPAYTFSSVVGDAMTAQYDCFNKSVFVNGPGDEAVPQSSLQYNGGWRHSWKRGQVTFNVYRNRFSGQGMFSAVPFAAEPGSIFPNGAAAYLASLRAVWSQPTVCGASPFDASRVYVSQYVSGLDQINQGFTVSGRVALGRSLAIFPNYAVSSASLSSLDPRLTYSGSYYTPGAQLPHHPLRTAGLTFDGIAARARLEWLLNAQFTASNNWQNLPAYTVYNAGVVVTLQRGSLRLFESNLFGTHTGLFTTYQGVDPLPVAGGGSFAFATTPLPPRSFTVEYDVRWAQRAPKKKEAAHHPNG
ncbi:MAG TPA: TonB-dependent receptor [Candidatus Baltobacteraceae bacterium]|nr:TonB-dependent receptor [Candidatus Baltobacteraceae bacterium]